jgi:Protein of unknown function (DUF3551)
MRTLIFALGALAIGSIVHSGPAAAQQAGAYPWCSEEGSIESCAFTSFQQCQATVSGVGQVCARNPEYAGARRSR